MIVCSRNVENVLLRFHLESVAKGVEPTLYYNCISAIEKIQTSIATIIPDRPLSWKRENGTIIKVGNIWFLYKKFDNGLITVEEVYDAKRNEILTESQYEPIKQILEFEKRMNKVEL